VADLVLTGTELNLELQAGDDAVIRFTFQTDVSGWTEWFAQVTARDGTTWNWTLNTLGLPLMVARLTTAQTADMYGHRGLEWQLQGKDDDGYLHTLFFGDVNVKKDKATP
jgi:hypothetical protein